MEGGEQGKRGTGRGEREGEEGERGGQRETIFSEFISGIPDGERGGGD